MTLIGKALKKSAYLVIESGNILSNSSEPALYTKLNWISRSHPVTVSWGLHWTLCCNAYMVHRYHIPHNIGTQLIQIWI